MYQFSNRECFWGRNYLPVDDFNYIYCWPPTYIKCDCSELAEYQKKGLHSMDVWQCPNCGKKYRLIQGTRNFEQFSQEKNL